MTVLFLYSIIYLVLLFLKDFFAKTALYLAKYGTGTYQLRARDYLVNHSLALIEPAPLSDTYKYVPIANWKHSPTKNNCMYPHIHLVYYNFFFD